MRTRRFILPPRAGRALTPEEMLESVAVVVNMNVWTAMPGPWDLIRRSPRTVLFLDLAGDYRSRGRLADKIATALTSSQTEPGGQESTTLAVNNTVCNPGATSRHPTRATRRSD